MIHMVFEIKSYKKASGNTEITDWYKFKIRTSKDYCLCLKAFNQVTTKTKQSIDYEPVNTTNMQGGKDSSNLICSIKSNVEKQIYKTDPKAKKQRLIQTNILNPLGGWMSRKKFPGQDSIQTITFSSKQRRTDKNGGFQNTSKRIDDYGRAQDVSLGWVEFVGTIEANHRVVS